MTDNCNIIRDLMPLVIDEVASEDSTQSVHAHTTHCESCRTYFDGMKKENSHLNMQKEEQAVLSLAAKKMKKKRHMRLLLNTLIGLVAGCLLAWCGLSIFSHLMYDYNQLVYHGFYGVTLSELNSGDVSVNIDYYGSALVCGVDFEETVEDGHNILYVYLERPIIKQYMANPHSNYSCTRLSPEKMEEIYEIRQGKPEEYLILWRQGHEIPAASEEMEDFFVLQDAYWALWNQGTGTADGKWAHSTDVRHEIEFLHEKMAAITVPEWQ